MASFEQHISQVTHNLAFLRNVNFSIDNCVDWQVTICFYTALHLVNAHLSKFGLQYRRHSDVKNALNPLSQVSPSKLPDDEYIAYSTLQMLSRRSRYLVSEKDGKTQSQEAQFTYEKHLAKSIRHLDTLLTFFCSKYSIEVESVSLKCSAITSNSFKHIKVEKE